MILPLRLQALFRRVEKCERCRKERNNLRHVFGAGQFKRPKFFFLFINPTHRNLSSRPDYEGTRRFPFIGVRHFWKELAEAGFMDRNIVAGIYKNGWRPSDEERIERHLRKESVYITNFVKCAQPHPRNPSRAIMQGTLPLLAEELEIVKPKYIVPFGLLPLSVLTNTHPRLRDILATVRKKTYKPMKSIPLGGRTYKLLPCYFMLGHGNPPKAKEILRYIHTAF